MSKVPLSQAALCIEQGHQTGDLEELSYAALAHARWKTNLKLMEQIFLEPCDMDISSDSESSSDDEGDEDDEEENIDGQNENENNIDKSSNEFDPKVVSLMSTLDYVIKRTKDSTHNLEGEYNRQTESMNIVIQSFDDILKSLRMVETRSELLEWIDNAKEQLENENDDDETVKNEIQPLLDAIQQFENDIIQNENPVLPAVGEVAAVQRDDVPFPPDADDIEIVTLT